MLNSRTLVEAFLEQAEKATYTTEDLAVYIVPSPEAESNGGEEMEVDVSSEQPSSSVDQQQVGRGLGESFFRFLCFSRLTSNSLPQCPKYMA